MQSEATIFDEPHHHALERLAAKALAEQDYNRALEFSDRRCRIAPVPQSHCFLLRAEASFRLGQKEAAIADLNKAIELSPNDPQANRRMLSWADGPDQLTAARSLLSRERNLNVLRRAVDVLGDSDRVTFASVAVLDEVIEGWAIWDLNVPAEISIISQDNVISSYLAPDEFHPLSSERSYAANFLLARPKSSEPQSISISVASHTFFSLRAPGNEKPRQRPVPQSYTIADDAPPTVIIPIYADFGATSACLTSLIEVMRHSRDFRAVLVDDATPDPKIKRLLDSIKPTSDLRVLTNATNLGFVGSINRALSLVDGGDVVLLNSDTVVPPGFVGRLALAARMAPDIGTVMPLSNNGEFSSFPTPHQSNPPGSIEDVILLDQLAASANVNIIVDIPSGIGFCLYITRACLNAVGQLSESYQRGYLEDVDFCLRAREAGFRSVCATSVYVGHVGSSSFGTEKRSLVVRNLDVLDRRFPLYRNECSAFVMADPLRSSREAIERLIPYGNDNLRLIVTGGGAVEAVARARARRLLAQGQPTMLLKAGFAAKGATVKPINPDGGPPQNIEFNIAEPVELRSLDEFLQRLQPSRFEIMDPAGISPELLDMLTDGRAPYDVFIADAGLLFPHGTSTAGMMLQLELSPVTVDASSAKGSIAEQSWQTRWRALAEKADHVLVPCPMAAAFANRHLPELEFIELAQPANRITRSKSTSSRPGPKLGIVPFRTSCEELRSIWALSQALYGFKPEPSIIVVGGTLDDAALIKSGKSFVTGAVEHDDLDRVLRQYQVGSLLLGLGQPLFGHPIDVAAERSGLPIARLDWSGGKYRVENPDIAIDAALDQSVIADLLFRWMEGR